MMENGKKAIVASLMSVFSIERFRLALIPVIGMVWSDLVLVWSRPPRLGLV
jgi:hypothetical protein